MNVRWETNDAKYYREHEHDRTSPGNHYHVFNSFQAKWFMAFTLCFFFKLKWQENMKGKSGTQIFKGSWDYILLWNTTYPLLNILLIPNCKTQSLWMQHFFMAINLLEVTHCSHTHSPSLQRVSPGVGESFTDHPSSHMEKRCFGNTDRSLLLTCQTDFMVFFLLWIHW